MTTATAATATAATAAVGNQGGLCWLWDEHDVPFFCHHQTCRQDDLDSARSSARLRAVLDREARERDAGPERAAGVLDAPPHIAHEWSALSPREQRDVLRWALRVVRQGAFHTIRRT